MSSFFGGVKEVIVVAATGGVGENFAAGDGVGDNLAGGGGGEDDAFDFTGIGFAAPEEVADAFFSCCFLG